MTGSTGEMSFLEHLEELRLRIIKAAVAIVAGFGVGAWAVDHFDLINVIKRPIAPMLPTGKLIILSPTEPVIIVLKLSLYVGLVLASPVIIYQIWAFLSPALYARERKLVVPALVAGLVLFLIGAALGYLFVVPPSLHMLLSFEAGSFENMITYQEYFNFVVHLVLAMGLSCELPLVIIILASLGLVTPRGLNRFRKMAVILALCLGAALSPSPDVVTMLIMTAPLLALYEIGFLGTVIVTRRRTRRAAATAALLIFAAAALLGPRSLAAQKPTLLPKRPPAAGGQDTTGGRRPGEPVDTAQARRLGLPTAPSGAFLPPDSILAALLARTGYATTRFRSDSATLLAQEHRIRLFGSAATERDSSTLEAKAIDYEEQSCILDARGDPRLFGNGSVLVSEGLRYDTCRRRAVVSQALTNFRENGANWFLRGDLAQDSSASRLYAASSNITSCDLPVPHYHFAAKQVKWISKQVMVARPAVLYVRDVPILWLPFIFQDGRPGRHSGILVPKFGLSDIVRPTPTFNRSITNVGYYWAPNDYLDLTGRLDWYSNRYVQYGFSGQYHWLDRFITGAASYSRQVDDAGGSSTQIQWDHLQNFDINTSLHLNLNYASNTAILGANAIDPLQSTQQIASSANFSRRFAWGTVTLGGTRRQNLNDGSVTQELPALTVVPAPFQLSRSVTWSPSFSLTQDRQLGFPAAGVSEFLPGGTVDTAGGRINTRTTTMSFATPFRFGDFTWQNSLSYVDLLSDQRQSSTYRVANSATPDPNDSLTVAQVSSGTFSTGLDWQTGVNLPILFRGSWKVTPSLGVTNVTSAGPFLLRNRATNGSWVEQGKRFQFGLTAAPTLFGFLNVGLGPIARIRHSLQPIITYSYSPSAGVPIAYARAISAPGQPLQLTSPATQLVSVSLSQLFEAKDRPTGSDTVGKKYKLLSITTSGIGYDFEQAKLPHRTGWTTQTITNSFQSDLLPQFSASLTHDLWNGTVGTDSATFDPFLTNVSVRFGLSGATFRSLARLVGLAGPDTGRGVARSEASPAAAPAPSPGIGIGPTPIGFGAANPLGGGTGGPFTASVTLTINRARPVTATNPLGGIVPVQATSANVALGASFSPTQFWNVSWNSQYDVTGHRFASQVVNLTRDLHEWRASFQFTQNANGNFAFYFIIALTDMPAVKFDYNQTTLQPEPSP